MPQSILLICPNKLSIQILKELITDDLKRFNLSISENQTSWEIKDTDGHHCTVYEDISDNFYNELREEYLQDEDMPEKIRRYYFKYKIFKISYSHFDLMNQLIKFLLEKLENYSQDIWIDNDYGAIMPYSEINIFLQNESDWRICRIDG